MPRGNPNWGKSMNFPTEPVIPTAWEVYLRSRNMSEECAILIAPMDSGIKTFVRSHRNRFIPEQVLAVLGERE